MQFCVVQPIFTCKNNLMSKHSTRSLCPSFSISRKSLNATRDTKATHTPNAPDQNFMLVSSIVKKTDKKSSTVCGKGMKSSTNKIFAYVGKRVSEWQCTSMCAVHDKLNAKNIQCTPFKNTAETHHNSASEDDSSHILKCKDCLLCCFFEAQERKFSLRTKTNALSWPEKTTL